MNSDCYSAIHTWRATVATLKKIWSWRVCWSACFAWTVSVALQNLALPSLLEMLLVLFPLALFLHQWFYECYSHPKSQNILSRWVENLRSTSIQKLYTFVSRLKWQYHIPLEITFLNIIFYKILLFTKDIFVQCQCVYNKKHETFIFIQDKIYTLS